MSGFSKARSIAFAFSLAALVLPACGRTLARPASARTVTAPTLEQLRGATIVGVYDSPVALKDGVYEGHPFVEDGASRPRLVLSEEIVAVGDLDGNPGDEAAVLLVENSGGSGEFVYLALMGTREGRVANLGTVLIGDRTKIRAISVSDRTVAVDVVEHGPDDPRCCPSQLARKSYRRENEGMSMVSSETTGTLSIATLVGVEWTLVGIDGAPLPADAKPPTATFESARIAGFGGCNRYTGEVKETAPGAISLGPIAATRMMCPDPAMQIEDRFLARLGKVSGYTFRVGRLVLYGSDGDASFRLEFAAKAAAERGTPSGS